MKPNLDQGNPAAKRANAPSPLAKTKRSNVSQQTPTSKPRNRPAPLAKNREAQTYRKNPTNVAPPAPEADRIRRELTAGKRSNAHSRKGG